MAVVMSACSSKPSDADAERIFRELNARSGTNTLFVYENVHRVDGYEKEVNLYVVRMQFDLVAKIDSDEFAAELVRQSQDDSPARSRFNLQTAREVKRAFGDFKKGQRFPKRLDEFLLRRTETGWAPAS